MILNRYLVFIYDTYYPRGGWLDFDSSHLLFEDAKLVIQQKLSGYCERAHIYDLETNEIVCNFCYKDDSLSEFEGGYD